MENKGKFRANTDKAKIPYWILLAKLIVDKDSDVNIYVKLTVKLM